MESSWAIFSGGLVRIRELSFTTGRTNCSYEFEGSCEVIEAQFYPRFPKLDFVSFRIYDPTKFSLRIFLYVSHDRHTSSSLLCQIRKIGAYHNQSNPVNIEVADQNFNAELR